MRLRIPYWWVLAIPILLFLLGAASNQAVLVANHGKFPVMLNEKQVATMTAQDRDAGDAFVFDPLHTKVGLVAGEMDENGQFIDQVHSVMGPNSRLKALADIFNLGIGIFSIGDFLILLGGWLWTFAPIAWVVLLIKKCNE